jgi:hypothetical protein
MTLRDYIRLVESHPYHKQFVYLGNCTMTDHGPYLADMMDQATKVSYREVYQAVGRATLQETFGDFYWGNRPNRKRGQMALHQDPYVSFYKSKFRGFDCYFVQESGIEHIFVDSAYQDVDWKKASRQKHAKRFYIRSNGEILNKLAPPIDVTVELADSVMKVTQSTALTSQSARAILNFIQETKPSAIDDEGEEISVEEYIENVLRSYL